VPVTPAEICLSREIHTFMYAVLDENLKQMKLNY
jgi:hypothetical protein